MLAIKVTFHIINEKIASVDLRDAPSFQWEIKESCSDSLRKKIANWIDCYLKKKDPSFSLPLLEKKLPKFTGKVIHQLAEIPFGQTVTYQEIAAYCGSPQGARAAGNACGKNPWPLIFPCHRVTGKGSIGGFSSGGLFVKKKLLQFEGN